MSVNVKRAVSASVKLAYRVTQKPRAQIPPTCGTVVNAMAQIGSVMVQVVSVLRAGLAWTVRRTIPKPKTILS